VYRYTRLRARNAAPRSPARREGFYRDAPTQLCYAVIAAYAFWLYASGPAFSLLRTELDLSYTMVGVYSAVWSTGAVLVGLSFAPLARRFSRAAVLWCSGVAATGGAAFFALGRTVPLTLLGDALLGFAGTTLLTCAQAILSDRHGEDRNRALVEANVGAAACAVLTPLLLGLLQGTPAGWRVAMTLPALTLGWLCLRYRRTPLPTAVRSGSGRGSIQLPLAGWLLAALVALGIAVEFCVVYFGAELLTATGLRPAQAAAAMSGFYLGILVGRVGGAWLTRRPGRDIQLLWASLAVTWAGFLLFWLAPLPALAVVGLFTCGLGVASLYPLSVALTLATAPRNGDTVQAVTQLLGGVLVVAAPYLLGSLADHVGLRPSFAVELVLIGASAVLLHTGIRAAKR
jgi:MFS family permease